jgi:predicted Zn-dependent peptidase
LHKDTGKPTGMIWLGYSAPGIFDKEDYAAMTLLNAVLAGYTYPGGWLHNELRGEGLVYDVQATQITGPVPGYFAVLAQTEPEKVNEVVKRILANIDKAKAGKIDEDEFHVAVDRVTSLHAQDQENTTIAAQAKLAALYELYGLGSDYDKTFDARIDAVKLGDVVRVARKYLGNYILATMSPEEKEK